MSDSIEQLKILVQQDISDLEQLKQVLIQEKQLLATRDVEQIKRISTQKEALVKQVESRAKQKAKPTRNQRIRRKARQCHNDT